MPEEEFVDKLRSGVRAGVKMLERGGTSPLTVFEPLLDLTLKEPVCLEKIKKALERTGAQLPEKPHVVKNKRYKEVQHKITLVRNGESRCLLAFPLEILLWEVPLSKHVAYDGACTFFINSLFKDLTKTAPGWNKKLYIVLPTNFNGLPEERRQGHKTFYRLTKFWEKGDGREKIEVKELQPELDFQDEDMVRDALSLREKEKWELLQVMNVAEQEAIAGAIDGFTEWKGNAQQRRTFVDVNFPEFKKWTGELNFVGGGRTVAKRFTRKLIDRSIEGKDNSLGIFLNYIKGIGEKGDMNRDIVENLEKIIKKYQLE